MRLLALDIETESDSVHPATDWRYAKLRGMGYYGIDGKESGWVKPEAVKDFLISESRKDTKFAFHYGKYDQKVLMRVTGMWVESFIDTHLAAGLLPDRPAKLKLDTIAVHYGVAACSWKESDLLEDTTAVPDATLSQYCLVDCRYTYELARTLYNKLKEVQSLDFFLNTLMVFANSLVKVEYTGINLDLNVLNTLRASTLKENMDLFVELETNFKAYTDEYEQKLLDDKIASLKKPPTPAQIEKYKHKFRFNFNSTDQLLWLLTNKLGVACKDRKNKLSTSKETLEKYADSHPALQKILNYRSGTSTVSQFHTLEEAAGWDSRIHTSFNLDIARTGRLSSSDPNIQNVKRGAARTMFVASPGYKLVVVDYAQIEPRVVAHLSRDETLIDAFHSSQDFYSVIIKGMLNLDESPEEIKANTVLRSLGKTVGLAVLYGIGPAKLAFMLTKAAGKQYSYQQAHACIETFYKNFKGLAEFRRKVMAYYAKHKALVNMFGRPVYMDAADVEHKAINAIVQGSASDLNCIANLKYLPELVKENGLDARLVHLVHDECIWEVRDDAQQKVFLGCVHDAMVKKFDLRVPLAIEPKIGDSWGVK